MINFSITKKSQLEGALRLDAEYYNPDVSIDFSRGKWKRMNDILSFVQYGTSDDLNEERIGYPTLRLNEFDGSFIEKPTKYCATISKKLYEVLKLEKNDVLICRTNGNPKFVGKSAIVMDDYDYIFASYLFRVRVDEKNIEPSVLMTYLNSRIGRSEIERFSLAGNQVNFSPSTLRQISVPVFPREIQNYIKSSVGKAFENNKLSKNLYQQAESLLLEELELKDFDNEEKLSSIVNLSEIESAHRIDAEYFQPKYAIIEEKIKKHNAHKLGDLVSMKKGIEVGAEEYQDEGKVFIRVSSMTKFGIVESDQKCLSDKLYESLKKDFEPKKGEILLTKDATLGVACVLNEDIRGIISGGTLRLKLKDAEVEAEYLALCLNSIIGQMQAERDAGGSIIAHWKPEQIRNVLIPILPKEIQQKIAELVRRSHEARKKSKELLEEAKRKVEEMIEKGGEGNNG